MHLKRTGEYLSWCPPLLFPVNKQNPRKWFIHWKTPILKEETNVKENKEIPDENKTIDTLCNEGIKRTQTILIRLEGGTGQRTRQRATRDRSRKGRKWKACKMSGWVNCKREVKKKKRKERVLERTKKKKKRRLRRDDCFPYGSGVKYLAQSVDDTTKHGHKKRLVWPSPELMHPATPLSLTTVFFSSSKSVESCFLCVCLFI